MILPFLAGPGGPVPGSVMCGGKAATGAKSSVPAVTSAGPTLTRRDKALAHLGSSETHGAAASPPFSPPQGPLKDSERRGTAPAADGLVLDFNSLINRSEPN